MTVNPRQRPEFRVGQLAEWLAKGYYAHAAALFVASNADAESLMPPRQPGAYVAVDHVYRKDGTAHVFYFKHFLSEATADAQLAAELKRVWLVGALLSVGDALAEAEYFDHAPELEMVYHLRNGVAHGNRFEITNVKRLAQYPAHTRGAGVKSDLKTEFVITPALHGQPVLFDYMEAGDILDLLMSVGMYLLRVASNRPGHGP